MLDNLIKIYLNADGSLKESTIDPVYKLSNQSTIVELVSPTANTNAIYIKFLLSNNAEAPLRRMRLVGTEAVEGQTWNKWQYRIPSSILAAASKLQAQSFYLSFFEQEIIIDADSGYRFLGLFETLDDLEVFKAAPSSSQPIDYAGVGGGLLSSAAIAYQGVAGNNATVWENTNKVVAVYESDNNIQNTISAKSTTSIQVSIGQSVGGSFIDPVDIGNTAIILNDLALLEGRIQDVELTFVDKDLAASYAAALSGTGTDLIFINNVAGNAPRYITLSEVATFTKQGVELLANKNQNNGYAGLDATGRIPNNLLPAEVVFFKGTFGSANSTTGGDLPDPNTADVGDTYLCDMNGFVSQVALREDPENPGQFIGVEFGINDEAVFDKNGNWVKVGAIAAVPEAPLDTTTYGRKNGTWVDVRQAIDPYTYKADITMDGQLTVLSVGDALVEFEANDTVFVYEDGVLLVEGTNYLYDPATGVIIFNNYTPEAGTIVTIQLLKKGLVSGILVSAANVGFNRVGTSYASTNVQNALVEIAGKTYTQTQLQTAGLAEIDGDNVRGLSEQTTILDEIEAINLQLDNITVPEGFAAVMPHLTKPAVVLQQDTQGNIVYTNSGTQVYVFEGPDTLVYDGVGTSNGTFRVVTAGTNITVGAITDGGVYAQIGDHSNAILNATPPAVQITIAGTNTAGEVFSFTVIQGISIALRGQDGADGADGADGVDGTSVVLKGSVNTVADLDNIVNPQVGDLYIVLADGNGYVYNGATWDNVGQIQGPAGADGTDGTDGEDGTDGLDGFNYAVINFYTRTTTETPVPTAPTSLAGDYNYSTGDLTNLTGTLNGFTLGIPASGGRYVWVSRILLASRDLTFNFTGLTGSTPEIITKDGEAGLPGPGVVYRGTWNSNDSYIKTDQRADVVESGGIYYVAILSSTGINPLNTTYWTPFGAQFESVATDILLAQNATITRGLVIGSDGANDGFIRSVDLSGLIPNAGEQGFFLDTSGQFTVGSGTEYMRWNGNALEIVGDIGGSVGQIDIGSPDTDGIRISADGIVARQSGNVTFNLQDSGDAAFSGTVVSTSGNIGGWSLANDRLTITNGAAVSTLGPNLIQSAQAVGNSAHSIRMSGNNLRVASGDSSIPTIQGFSQALNQTTVLAIDATRLDVPSKLQNLAQGIELESDGTITLDGSSVIVDSNTLQTNNVTATGNIIPGQNATYNIGTISGIALRWANIYLTNQPNVSSDIRLKENVAPVGSEYNDIILNTNIITYNNLDDDKPQIGISANEFAEQFGEQGNVVVQMGEDGYYGANYVAFVPMLIKLAQDQHAEIEELKARLNNLENSEV